VMGLVAPAPVAGTERAAAHHARPEVGGVFAKIVVPPRKKYDKEVAL